jgi:hypothetical protein
MSAQYRLAVDIPGLPPLNSADNVHWRKRNRIKRQWKELTAAHIPKRLRPPHPLRGALVILTRASSVTPDPDNLAQGFKHIQDALVDIGLIPDDSPEAATIRYGHLKVGKGNGFIRIEVWEGN